jgi:tRNA(His) guanylyltransferase
MGQDNLGDRMKGYEDANRIVLPRRMPVLMRLDGIAFHTYTKGLKRPVDDNLVHVMNETAMELCRNIQGVKVAYIQSDEISLLINNYEELETQPWYGNNVQKMVSASAAMASSAFNELSPLIWNGKSKRALFDSRVWVHPKEDVNNYFLWRQNDASRNSVQSLARTLYSHKQLIGASNSKLQEMCFQKGQNWNDVPTAQKRGRCIVKNAHARSITNRKTGEMIVVSRWEWEVDDEIPIFSKDPNYIEQYL